MLKFVKRFCFFVCALALVCTFVPQANAKEDDDFDRYGYSLLKNDKQREAYEELEDGIEDCDAKISFKIKGITADDIKLALHMVLEDYPEYFWFDGNASLQLYSDGKVEVYPQYSVDGKAIDEESVKKYSKALEDAADEALKDLPKGNDREKAHYLHDYVASKVEYVSGEDDQTAYGALVEGKAVCAGYSRAYQYLLQKAGIKAWYITGTGRNPTSGKDEPHGWNLLFLDGKCYYTDVTWDDQKNDTYHAYFLLSLEEMSQTHRAENPEYLPNKCGHGDMDYFVVHGGKNTGVGTLKSGFTAQDVAGFMKETSKGTWQCHLEDMSGGDRASFYSWLQNNIADIAMSLGLSGSLSYSFSSLWDEYRIAIIGSAEHVHAFPLTKVKAVASTCTQGGHSVYYTCSTCGEWFSDSNAANPIADHSSINTSPKGHSYTVTKNTANEHWKQCSVCGVEEPGSRATHADNNKDNTCDSCGIRVQSSSQSDPTTDPTVEITTKPTEKPTEPKQDPTTEPTVDVTEDPTEAPVVESTGAPTEEPTQESTQAPTAGNNDSTENIGSTDESESASQGTVITNKTEQDTTQDSQDPNDTQDIAPLIPIVIVALVVVAAVVAIIGIRRKRR